MKNKPSSSEQLSQREIRLIEQLRKHPEIRDRVQSILELAQNTEGPLKTADEVEELLIQEVRKLGNATMRGHAGRGARLQRNQSTGHHDPQLQKKR